MPDAIYILFLFALGACVGSFLNVVVYRLPREESLSTPPSHCPQCQTRLAWYDNIPVFGWLMLAGKCRYCKKPISPRYPIVEAITGGLFVFYYVMFFMLHAGPSLDRAFPHKQGYFAGDMTSLAEDWPIYALYMFMIAGLLAASLIDADLYIIPASIPWWTAAVAMVVHAIVDSSHTPGSLNIGGPGAALSMGAGIGLILSIVLLSLGYLPMSFPEGNLLEIDRERLAGEAAKAEAAPQVAGQILDYEPPELSAKQIRAEIRKEILFLFAPLALGAIAVLLQMKSPLVHGFFNVVAQTSWSSGFLGSLLGAMVGGFIVWVFRIGGSIGFGREAMGLGDVHLMFGVGAVLGGGAAVIAFFIAPFFGIAVAVYMLLTGTRRQLPYGPYLSLATTFIMLFYSPIADYLRPGLIGLGYWLRSLIGQS